ncbi:MAG: peptide deformylase [Propionibacteriaceae bacterium]|jgi:peptide deformylase|nr:peptide deformylase [Propionibacteriaceae bacterium]
MVELKDLLTGGQVQRVTRWSEDVLHQPTAPIDVFDERLHSLIQNMFATMAAADGVGLAATQVDQSLSLFVFACPDDDNHLQVGAVINPTVILPEGNKRHLVSEDEGCLSLPGAYAPLARPDQAICRGLDHNGEPIEIIGTGLLARCLQHETDHLSGMVFGDRLSGRSRRHLYADHDALAYRYPDDWPISPKRDFDPSRHA